MAVQRFFEAPDGIFSYLEWGGKGPLAHLAHATGFCAGVYDPLAQILSSRLAMVGMDHRGHGKTSAPAVPKDLVSWGTFANDLGSFFEGLREPVIAIGHSLGAVSSMILAANRPELVRALILIDPTIMPPMLNIVLYMAQRLNLTRLFPIVAGAAKRNPVWPTRVTVFNSYSHKVPFNRWSNGFLEAYLDYGFEELHSGQVRLRCDPAWEARCFSTCPAGSWKITGKLNVPVLIIYGSTSDVFLEKSARRFKSKCPTAQLERVEGVGHFVPMEKPTQTADAIFRFLRQLQIL